MAILSFGRAARWPRAWVALLLLCGSCALIGRIGGGEKRFAFSHRVHVVDEAMSCVSCHENFARADDPGMPSPDTCAVCHEETDAEKPPERQVAGLFDGENFRALRAAKLDEEVIFSHKLHAKDPASCGGCHVEIDTNEAIDSDIGVRMERCETCHQSESVASECSTCHTQVDVDWAPPSHSFSWRQRHGPVVRGCAGPTADNCSICHTESTCVACHREEAPTNHNAFCRNRSHGLLARMDRASCATCHTPDSCEQCHADTRPVSHTGSWGGSRSRHCVSCHQPLESEGCVVCHRSTPSHQTAAPKPAWHTPVMNCRQCHGLTQPLPHVDNGDDCNACHQ